MYRIEVHARLLILRKNSPLHGLILVCTFIDFETIFPPARLFCTARLFGTLEYVPTYIPIPINVQDGIDVQGGTFSQNQ